MGAAVGGETRSAAGFGTDPAEPDTADYAHKASYLSAAMLASAEHVPDTPAAAQE